MLNEKLCSQILGGSLIRYSNYLAGSYRGYYVVIYQLPYAYNVQISATLQTDNGNAMLNAYLQNYKTTQKKLTTYQTTPYSFTLTVKAPNLVKNAPAAINEVVEPVIQYLMGNMYISGCTHCGSTFSALHNYQVNGTSVFLCEECAAKLQTSLAENQKKVQAQKSNLITGIVGAVLGALLGCILWILIYKLGYIAGLAGALIAICAMKGYTMFGKCLDKKGVVASVLIMIAAIYFANRISWAWEAYDAFKSRYTFFEAYQSLGEILWKADAEKSYYLDLIIGYVLTLLCSFSYIVNAFRASNGSYTIKKS